MLTMWDVRLETPKSLEPGSMTLLYRTVGGIRLFHVDHSFLLYEVERNTRVSGPPESVAKENQATYLGRSAVAGRLSWPR